MPIPVPITPGPEPIDDIVTARAEAWLAAYFRTVAAGTSGSSLNTPGTTLDVPNTGTVAPLVITSAEQQLFFRQLAISMAKVVPDWIGGSGGAGNSVFNEIPVGATNGVNKLFGTSNKFVPDTTQFYYNGMRLLLGIDYTENGPGYLGVTITPAFPAPKSGDNIVIDYVKAT